MGSRVGQLGMAPRSSAAGATMHGVQQATVMEEEGGGETLAPPADSVLLPVEVKRLETVNVTHVAAGPYNSAFLSADGEVWTCGANDAEQLGVRGASASVGSGGMAAHPVARVDALDVHKVVHAAFGQSHALAVTDKGAALAWGSAEWGQLGLGTMVTTQANPRLVRGVKSRVARVAAGAAHSLILTTSGQVYSFGQATYGALGHGSKEDSLDVPRQVMRLWHVGVVQVSAGEHHSMALSADGRLFAFGRGKHGQLGLGNFHDASVPQPVRALQGIPIVQVVCGSDHTLALSAAGLVYAWGRNGSGQLGLGSVDNTCVPSLVQGALDGLHVVQVTAGLRHSAALTSGNKVLLWGCGEQGQLGVGRVVVAQLSPLPLPHAALPSHMPVLFIAAGGDTTIAVAKELTPGEQAIVGPLASSPVMLGNAGAGACAYGAGAVPMALPQLQQLVDAARMELQGSASSAQSQASSAAALGGAVRPGGSGGGAVGPAVAALVNALEDVFSSPGFLAAGFSLPSSAPSSDGQPAASGGGADAASRAIVPGCRPPAEALGGGGREATQERVVREAMRRRDVAPHALCVPVVNAVYSSLLLLYSAEVVYALGAACAALLDTLHIVLEADLTPDAAPDAHRHHPPLHPASNAGTPTFGSPRSTAAGAAASAAASPQRGGGRSQLARMDQAWLPPAAVLPALLVLLQNPLNAHASVAVAPASMQGRGGGAVGGGAASLWTRLVAVWGLLPQAAQRTLAHWLAALPPEVFGGRVLRPLQQHIARCCERGGTWGRTQVLAAGQVVMQLHDAHTGLVDACCTWGCTHPLDPSAAAASGAAGLLPLPLSEWSNATLSESANLREEYMVYIQEQEAPGRGGRASPYAAYPPSPITSLLQAPVLLTPEAKSRILQGEASVQKQHVVQSHAVSALLQGINPHAVVYLDVHVRRDRVLQDAMTQILHRAQDLKKPLRVVFIGPGGVPEEGLDEGGVSREFFQLVVAELFKPEYGMFSWNEETRTYFFSEAAFEYGITELEFKLVGAILGLAIFNNVILDVHFPLVVYKKLLGHKPGWRDLCETQPTLARGLAALLAFDGDVEATFCRTFEVEYEVLGTTRTRELLPGGSKVPVTDRNRQSYVELYTKWVLEDSVQGQFLAFLQGFHEVCGGPALGLLSPAELELLVAGLPHLDFTALEKAAKYDGGYTAASEAVRWFWQELHAMTLEQKRRFLSFTTGCDRAPVGGLGKLTLVIQRSGPDSDRLPTSHTCFNVLLLPEYATQAKLRERLLTAINNAQGFGLQ